MPHSVTITAKTGPNRTNTAMAFPNVETINFNLTAGKLQLHVPNQAGNQIKEYDLTGVTTVTCTVTAGVWAFVLS